MDTALLTLFLLFACGTVALKLNNDLDEFAKVLTFPQTYITKATMFIPYSEIMEPFQAWYDVEANASRVDYYGGMVKTYQLQNVGRFGEMLKIAPVTTESSSNVKTCLQVNGSAEIGIIKPQTVVPDLSQFKFIGKEIVRGMDAEKWQYIDTVGERVNKYTIYIRYQAASNDSGAQIPVPIKFVMKGVNTVFGSHYDHYWIEYDTFSDEKPDPSVFQVTDMKCQPFPGPGIDHVYTFNPIREFVEWSKNDWDSSFENYKKKHGKRYNDLSEHAYRKEIFKHNLRFIKSQNRAHLGYTLAVNHLADRTPVELRALRGRRYTPGYNGGKPFPYDVKQEAAAIPESFDWRIYGAVTPVKDQSVCGSCWSFGTTGAIEGEYFVHSGTLLRLSQQALIDCSWGFGNNGCDGGEDFRSYEWMLKHGGLPKEDEYGPYYGQDGYCHVENVTLFAPITGWVNVTVGDENALKIALLKHGPISIAIDASQRGFTFYNNGVFYDPHCGNKPEQLDHAVLLVGFGKLYGQEYWLVKNSWSNYWGNDGFILMSPKDNNCGVMTAPTYVTF